MARTIDEWVGILGTKRPEDAAKAILGDLTHYQEGHLYEDDDREQLANALQAWAKIHSAPDEDD